MTIVEDSRRWSHVDLRDDDIVISTPPKSGTTWTQGILCSLVFSDVDVLPDLSTVSLWIDNRFRPPEALSDAVEQMGHRRFMKTHSPADAIPFDDDVDYVAVYRDGRDALTSWANHRRSMRPEVVGMFNELSSVDGVEPWALVWDGDLDALYDEWSQWCSPTTHLASWWPERHRPNVHLVHYADLIHDLEGEMRSLAATLNIEVADDRWPAVVERCRLDDMREAARAGLADGPFDGGADAFFYRGGNGRWRDVLGESQLEQYRRQVERDLPGDAAAWLEHGSIAIGSRPADM